MAASTITLRNIKGSPLTNTEMDTNISLLNSYSKGYLSKSITTNITLTDIEAENYFFAITGTLTADATITIPSILVKSWTVHNGTSGGFNITVKYATGSGITIQNGTRSTFYFDGTNMQSISYSNTVRISDTGTVTSTMIADGTIVNGDINASAAIAISKLASSTISGISLGNNLNALTIGTGLSGTSYNGTAGVTIAINSTVALRADVHYIGTTSIALNRTSANLALTGISSITLPGSTSGTVQLIPTAAVGTGTILTIPATTGTIVTTGDSGTVTNTMLAGSIANAKLVSSTISGVSLGNNLNALTISTGLSGTSYNGYTGVTIAIDSTVATLTGIQTLTNKTLTNPTINGFTGDTSIVNIGSGQIYKDVSGNVGIGNTPSGTYKLEVSGSISGTTLRSSVATGTAPFTVASTTPVANLSIGGNAATVTNGVYLDTAQTLTNKTLTSPAVTTSLTTGSTTFNLLNTTATTINIGGAATAVSIGDTAHAGTTTVQNNLYVNGNITFGGGSTQLSATQLVVNDPLIYIGSNNAADIIDLGFVGAYNNGTHLHTGLVRDASDSIWKLFTGMSGEPTGSTLDFTGATYAPLQVGSVILPGSTSGAVQLKPTAAVGTGTILTIPATTGTIITTGDSGTVTNTMLAGSIANAKLVSSTISGVSLGSNLNALTISSPLVGTSYNGTAGVTLSIPAATTSVSGYLTSTDWTTFNGKQAALGTASNLQVNSIGVGTAAAATAGDIRATANITAYYTSDERLKENISPITNALEKVNQINGVNFDWTEEEITARGGIDGYFVRKNDVGVIAQEIEQVLPEAVATRDNGYKAVRYELIVPLLIESIKELSEQNQQLLKRIDVLENK